jgi:preprotein translocase subunit SecF
MIKFIPESTNIPFMSFRWPFIILSSLAVIASLVSITVKGFNFGVDFAGGVQMVLRFEPSVQMEADRLRSSLDRIGLSGSVQNFGTTFDEVTGAAGEGKPREFMVHFPSDFVDPDYNAQLLKNAFAPLATAGSPLVAGFRFSGFEKAYFTLTQEVPVAEVERIVKAIAFKLLQFESVTPFGPAKNREFEIRFREVSSKLLDRIATDLQLQAGRDVSLLKVDFVGSKVGSDLKWSAILSTIITLFLIFLYIFIRFDIRYAPGGVISLAHDVIVTAGMFSFFQIEFDLTVVAALLTLAGYSINDTIVIFDRIREIVPELKGKKMLEIIDIALNQTLGRTIITSLTVLMATAVLWVFGGPVIHGFAFALTFGVLIGSYSTVFVASAILLWFYEWAESRHQSGKAKVQAA